MRLYMNGQYNRKIRWEETALIELGLVIGRMSPLKPISVHSYWFQKRFYSDIERAISFHSIQFKLDAAIVRTELWWLVYTSFGSK